MNDTSRDGSCDAMQVRCVNKLMGQSTENTPHHEQQVKWRCPAQSRCTGAEE